MVETIIFSGHKIGKGQPCFIIAEAGVNHNGSLGMARQLVDEAAKAGANAVKFQTFKAEKVVMPVAPKANYQKETTGEDETQLEMLKKLELPYEAFSHLFGYCLEKDILFLSTPFDEESADFLDKLGVVAFKIPSGEITNLPFLAHLAHKGRPLIISTGMSNLGEVENALETITSAGNPSVALLHCVSNYPADPSNANLRAMHTLEVAFGVSVGFSDHTLGIEIPLAAVALGASIIEKHFTLDKNLPGPDHRASLEPDELLAMIQGIRKIESALGDGVKRPAPSESESAAVARRSLVAAQAIPEGTIITESMIAIRRPGSGLPPAMRNWLIGRRSRHNIPAGALLTLEMLA
jgi:N,N'-diacetyllegionaminate synthase